MVIMDTEKCINEVNRQLSNKEFYQHITENPTDEHNQIIKVAIDSFVGRPLIKQEVGQGLKISIPRTARFYILPKIHKKGQSG